MYKGMDDYLMSEMDNDGQQGVDLNATGMARGGLPDQMEMNFGEVPDNTVGIDPVSGNEIPLGSSAKEVRDDIPAQLSEGEMVIPADVVRFFGVKFFEDLRQAAKIGYAKMDADGRIGGEPIMEDESGLGLDMADLQVVEVGDDSGEMMGESEEAFLGKFFAGLRESSKKAAQQKDDEPRDRSISAIKERVAARKDKPKNRYEALIEQMKQAFRDDDDRPERGPKNKTPSMNRAQTGGKLDFGFRGNPMERGARKFGDKSDEQDAGQIEEAYTGENLRSDKSFAQRFMEGLGYDEGGLSAAVIVYGPDGTAYSSPQAAIDAGVTDYTMTPPKTNFPNPRIPTPVSPREPEEEYVPEVIQEGTTGGFGRRIGLGSDAIDPVTGGVMEAREYQNDAGNKIIIMFLNGEPLSPIPEGYYPVGSEPVVVEAGEAPTASGGGRDDDGPDMPTPTPIDYSSLSLEELTEMVEDQRSVKGDAIATGITALSPLVGGALRAAMWDQSRRTKKEIERRIASGELSNVDKIRYENLLEVAEREQPGFFKTLFGKVTGKYTGPELPSPTVPDFDVSDPTMAPSVATPYTPEIKTAETPKGAVFTPERMEAIQKIISETDMSKLGAAVGIPIDDDDDDKGPTITPPAPTYTKPATDPYAEPGRPTSSKDDDDDDEPTFAPPPPAYTQPSQDPYAEPGRPTGGGRRGGGGGRNKGGLMKNKKKKATNKKKK
jgi:hypothetical protein